MKMTILAALAACAFLVGPVLGGEAKKTDPAAKSGKSDKSKKGKGGDEIAGDPSSMSIEDAKAWYQKNDTTGLLPWTLLVSGHYLWAPMPKEYAAEWSARFTVGSGFNDDEDFFKFCRTLSGYQYKGKDGGERLIENVRAQAPKETGEKDKKKEDEAKGETAPVYSSIGKGMTSFYLFHFLSTKTQKVKVTCTSGGDGEVQLFRNYEPIAGEKGKKGKKGKQDKATDAGPLEYTVEFAPLVNCIAVKLVTKNESKEGWFSLRIETEGDLQVLLDMHKQAPEFKEKYPAAKAGPAQKKP
jgi:hypothetical protein